MKKTVRALLIAFPFLTLYLQSCDFAGGKCKGCTQVLTSIDSSSFPLAANNQWLYQRTDNNSSAIDTVIFTITGKNVFGSDSTVFATLTTAGSITIDSGTILKTSGSVLYRPTGTQSLFEFLKLVFPVTANSAWQGYYPGDSLHLVSNNEYATILNYSYTGIFEISRKYITPGYAVLSTTYMVPNVGIIEAQLYITVMQNSSNKTVRLISYSLH